MSCPDLETLFQAVADEHGEALDHARSCAACAEVMEAHRQLEKDLFRLADPLPPADLVPRVMARVAAEPPPVRVELRVGLSILAATLMATVLSFVATQGPLGLAGTNAARAFVTWRNALVGFSNGMHAVWSTAAAPLVVGLATLLLLSLVALRRLSGIRAVPTERLAG